MKQSRPTSWSVSGSLSVLTPKEEEKIKISLEGGFPKEASVRNNSLETRVSTAYAPGRRPSQEQFRMVVSHHQPVWLYNSWLCALE